MAKMFDPRKVLKHIANPLLREFFRRRGELLDVPWDELTEHRIEPVFKAWLALPPAEQQEIQLIMRDINELADHRGLAVLAEEMLWRCPERAEEYRAQVSRHDKAMWVYLHVPEAFNEAAMFARADALSSGRYWIKRNGLPQVELNVDDAVCQALARALTSFYGPLQLRGRQCKVEHYQRAGHADYFFAYLDDYPDKRLVFDEDSDEPLIRSDRYAFEVVFVYNRDEGSLELFAQGGQRVWSPLQVEFCKAVLNEEVDPADPIRPSFYLDHLLNPLCALPTDPADLVEEARITRLRFSPRGSGGWIEVKADAKAPPDDIYRKIDRHLKKESIVTEGTRVMQATFALKFHHDGKGRQKTMTFNVTAPNSCDLKHKPDEQRVVGERCLRLWEVSRDAQ